MRAEAAIMIFMPDAGKKCPGEHNTSGKGFFLPEKCPEKNVPKAGMRSGPPGHGLQAEPFLRQSGVKPA